jgi:hypothetical protein
MLHPDSILNQGALESKVQFLYSVQIISPCYNNAALKQAFLVFSMIILCHEKSGFESVVFQHVAAIKHGKLK